MDYINLGVERFAGSWIPVVTDLPAEGVRCLVTCESKKGMRSINLAYYMSGFWHGQGSMSGVIAWAYLPACYSK